MYMLECPLIDSLEPTVAGPLVLSVIVPSYNRTQELILCVSSIAEQLTGGLEDKVEILITDNASEEDTVEAIRGLAERYPNIGFMLHARDEGGFFNLFAAPFRARGDYTWAFGSDDALLPGGIEHVVGILEREKPSFLTINKKLFNKDFTQEIWPFANSIPERRFDTFVELMCAVGINQLAFLSGTVDRTEAARAVDPEFYLTADTRHPHVAAFLEKHCNAPAYYSSEAYVVHRADNSELMEYHLGNFFDYAVTLPAVLWKVIDRIGAPRDLFERINGDKRIQSYDTPVVTYVDNIFENLLRSLGGGKLITPPQRRTLQTILSQCGSTRLEQFDAIWDMHEKVRRLEQQSEHVKAVLGQARNSCMAASATFTRQG